VFTENSTDWIDRIEVIKTDREYLLVVKKELMGLNLPNKNRDVDKSRFSDKKLTL